MTLPNFPCRDPRPQGTLPGVSSFQVHLADHDILTPGDRPDVLVAMNPAALKANIGDPPRGATIIVDTHDFTARNLAKAGYDANRWTPWATRTTPGRIRRAPGRPATGMTVEAVKQFGLSRKDASRAKNMFALGLLSWMYGRPTDRRWRSWRSGSPRSPTSATPTSRRSRPAGTSGDHRVVRGVLRDQAGPDAPPGTYRNITGNLALAYGLVAAGVRSGLPVFLGSYPITPASDILHELSKHKAFGVTTLQAEDEIAGIGAAIGASFGAPWA